MSETTKARSIDEMLAAIGFKLNTDGWLLARSVAVRGWDAGYRQALEDAAKLICPNCENGRPLKNPAQWIWNHEVPGIGTGPCYAPALHDKIRALGERGL